MNIFKVFDEDFSKLLVNLKILRVSVKVDIQGSIYVAKRARIMFLCR